MSLTKLIELSNKVNRGLYVEPMEETGPEEKRRRTLKPEVKLACLKAMSRFYCYIIGVSGSNPSDIQISMQIAGILKTAFQMLKQQHNKAGALSEKMVGKKFEIGYEGKTREFKAEMAIGILQTCLKSAKLYFERTNDELCSASDWIGVMSPLISFTYGFGLRLKELRLGHHEFGGSEGGKATRTNVMEMGLESRHHVLLEGITYPPDVQSSMAQSLGPLTACLKLALSNKSKYTEKYEKAVARFYQHLDLGESIATALLDSGKAQAPMLLSKVADLSLLVPPRFQRRAFFPLHLVAVVTLNEAEIKASVVTSNKIMNVGTDPFDASNKNGLAIDFSGKGAFALYNQYGAIRPYYRGLANEGEILSQVIFHSIWGSFAEDFGILSVVTNCTRWFTRGEFNDTLKKSRNNLSNVLVPIIRFNFFSKLVSGNVSNVSSGQKGQVTSVPSWSGRREMVYSKELVQSLQAQGSGSAFRRDFTGVVEKVSEEIGKALEGHSRQEVMNWGNTQWRRVVGTGIDSMLGDEVEMRFSVSNKFFLSG
nr:MAG: nucleocapsid [Bat faecal associated orthomyxo-like virus 1]